MLDLSQGVPGGPPPDELRAALGISAASVAGNSYGPILGEPALRRLLTEEMKVVYGNTTDVGPNDVGLTAGCNLAFFASIMALASPGDEIILPVPWRVFKTMFTIFFPSTWRRIIFVGISIISQLVPISLQ